MTLASTIIQNAFREGNLIPIGTSPTANEQLEALERLNAFMQGIFGSELGEHLVDWPVPQPQRTAPVAARYPQLPQTKDLPSAVYPYPPANSRLVYGGTAQTVYFPEAPCDGARMALVQGNGGTDGDIIILKGNGRRIEAAAQQQYTRPVSQRSWMYRADLADWVVVAALSTGAADLPFPALFDDLWVCALSIRLAPRYGKTVHAATAAAYTKMLAKFETRYRQEALTTYGASNVPNTSQSYRSR